MKEPEIEFIRFNCTDVITYSSGDTETQPVTEPRTPTTPNTLTPADPNQYGL